MTPPEPMPAAVALAEQAAWLYCAARDNLPSHELSERLLDNLFTIIVDLELIAGCGLGPLAREVLTGTAAL